MRRIHSTIDTNSSQFLTYQRHNQSLVDEFRQRDFDAKHKRPQKGLDRLEKQGKNLASQRVEMLLDPGTPFLELSSLAANASDNGEAPGASVLSGIGIINGREVIVIAGDGSIKGGAWFPLSAKKITRALDIAIENHLPVVHLVDSAGAFLQLQSELFADKYHGGRVFRNQCILSGLGIEQVAVVMGHCTAGSAYVPTLCDYSIIVRKIGACFLGGPPLVKAATGEEVTVEELGGADVHASISGTSDYAVNSEEEGIALAREIVGTFRKRNKAIIDKQEIEAPYYDPEELYGIIPDDVKKQFDVREVIARIVDGSRFHEFKPDYGETLICGFAHIMGYKVGILGNNGVLFNDSAKKAAQFMQHCNRSRAPVVFLQNITGFMIGKEYEHEGICKDGAKMLMTQVNLDVPKFTVMINGSFGAGNYAMCGRAYDARFHFIWPQAQTSLMGSEQAAKTLTGVKVASLQRRGEVPTEEEIQEIHDAIAKDFAQRSSAYYSTSELWDDGIIDPADTRKALGMAISASLNKDFKETANGYLRL
ncbi:MAG: methylcrotonoyl-CoA carboxylase [Halieaceae bacterium]|nr:methylcrotonoyl-CoA carboxylase [Halieaceae bacterium]